MRHPERHRHDHALERLLLLDLRQRLRGDRKRRRPAHHPRGRGSEPLRPGHAMGRRRRQTARTRNIRARGLGPAGQTQPMHLSDDRIAGEAVAEQARDLARALAVRPMLLELLDYLVRPSHSRLAPSILAKGLAYAESDPHARRTSSGGNANRHSRKPIPHDISWASRAKLHYSLNPAQESPARVGGAFPQLDAGWTRFSPVLDGSGRAGRLSPPEGAESDQGVSAAAPSRHLTRSRAFRYSTGAIRRPP